MQAVTLRETFFELWVTKFESIQQGSVLDKDHQTPSLPQKEPMVRFLLAYVSDDFKMKKNVQKILFYEIFKHLRKNSLHFFRLKIV